jgi:hypothetical protein
MKIIIEELRASMEHELRQVGLTPRTNFIGTQDERDAHHNLKADKYKDAIKILSGHQGYKSKCEKLESAVKAAVNCKGIDEIINNYPEVSKQLSESLEY